MPIYEYACEQCGHHVEIMQKISDDPIQKCPKCGKDSLIRLVSAAGFRLKGGGWYETDFKDTDKKRNLASQDSETSSKENKMEGESKKDLGKDKETKSDATSNTTSNATSKDGSGSTTNPSKVSTSTEKKPSGNTTSE